MSLGAPRCPGDLAPETLSLAASNTDYKRLSEHLATGLTSLMAASFGLEDVYVDIMTAAPSADVNTGPRSSL